MLLIGGIVVLGSGLVFMLAGDKVIKDAEKAAKAKKQAPYLVAVGAVMVVAAFVMSGMLA